MWRLADPKISLASISSMVLGACAAASLGPLDYFWLGATVLGILLIEVGKNASGEIFDFAADAAVREEDRSPFSGGKRVLIDRLLTRRQAAEVAIAGFGGGLAIGLWIAVAREPRILWIGVLGATCAYFYNGAPVRLAHRGLGELAVGICYGPLIFAGTVLVQRHELPWTLLAVSLPLGLLIATFLWICEFPDFEADRSAGKRNLVVRLGRRRASLVFPLLFAAAALGIAALPLMGAPRGAVLGLAFILPAIPAATTLVQFPESTRLIIPAQALTLAAFMAYSIGAGLGLLLLR
ncbi:MAG TPA: prenyltransferase [Planctomycetota bacterium]|nr:prenyltransferase [Planctomycetota bacterium]